MMKAGWQWIFSLNPGSKQRNRWLKLHGHFAIQESKRAQNHVQVTCTITVCSSFSCFNFILRLETQVEGTQASNLLLPHFFDIERMSQNILLKIYEGNVSTIVFAEFTQDIDRKILN